MFSFAVRGVPSFGDLAWHAPVTDVAYGALSASTLAPAAGVSPGQTLTKAANGAIGLEANIASTAGVALGDRLLVTSEASPKNGIYVVTSLGSAGAPWVLTRAVDMDIASEAPVGSIAYDLTLGGLWVAVGGGSGAWTLSPNQVGSLFLGLPADLELRRSAAHTLELSNAAGGAGNLSVLGTITVPMTGSTVPTVNGGGTATFAGVVCKWTQIGSLVVFRIKFSVTANGSGALTVTVTGTGLPQSGDSFQALADRAGVGVQAVLGRMTNAAGELTVSAIRTVAASTVTLTGADLLSGAGYSFAGAYLTA